jgi:hypothetical protein
MPYVIMIRCPNTDKAISTGVVCDIKAFEQTAPAQLHCSECGQIHEWSVTDAWLRDRIYDSAMLLKTVPAVVAVDDAASQGPPMR